MQTDKPYTIHLTETAKSTYLEIARKAQEAEDRGEETSYHCTTLRMVNEILDQLIPHDPINKKHALAGQLSNIFRYKKGRMRLYWIASSKLREVYILYISDTPRKEGDVRDPYEIFSRLVMSGKFNEIFEELGVKIPKKMIATVEGSLGIH